MKLNELSPSVERKSRKRIGRGESSGQGKTAGKGSNGQKSRSGKYVKPYFEGGQMPLYRRVPKRGFSNSLFKKDYAIITLDLLNGFEDGAVVTPELLVETGKVRNLKDGIKVLGNGTIDKKITVKAHKVSASAKAAIEAKGGNVEIIEVKTFVNATTEDK